MEHSALKARVWTLLEQGHPPNEVHWLLQDKIPKTTLYRYIKRYKPGFCEADLRRPPKKGGRVTKIPKRDRSRIAQALLKGKSCQKLAEKYALGISTIQRIAKAEGIVFRKPIRKPF